MIRQRLSNLEQSVPVANVYPIHNLLDSPSYGNLPCYHEFIGLIHCTDSNNCVARLSCFVDCLNKNNILGRNINIQSMKEETKDRLDSSERK